MDLAPVNALSASAGLPNQTSGRQAPAQVVSTDAPAARAKAQVEAERLSSVQKSDRPSVEKDAQATDAGIRFEYGDGHRVMKVNDSKGVLIYQVPPKGEIQLILDQEHSASMLQTKA